jgi:hypothetical protein
MHRLRRSLSRDQRPGVLDEVHVFGRALADAEIAEIAAAPGGLCP